MIKCLLKRLKKLFGCSCQKDEKSILAMGKQLSSSLHFRKIDQLHDAEFSIFSQWGEDGIIEFLVRNLGIENRSFIEFGVEDYSESNTRFLMMNRDWQGLVIDGSTDNIQYIRQQDYFWKYNLQAVNAFITKDNINDLIQKFLNSEQIAKDIGLLSVDIDGVDYWVLKEINSIDPHIIICEYNSILPNDIPLTAPYDAEFVRGEAHYSHLYWGANLKAFYELLTDHGYVYLGSNLKKTNAFFVKKDALTASVKKLVRSIDLETSTLRESRDKDGNLSFLSGDNRLKEIQSMPFVRLDNNETVTLADFM